jgi:hypothetical protein
MFGLRIMRKPNIYGSWKMTINGAMTMTNIITKRQQVELDGKTYEVIWYGERALVYVFTRKGRRTLQGHGRANRAAEAARVISKAK